MKKLIGLVLFAVEFMASCIATCADFVIMVFKPFSKGGHAIEKWCDKNRRKLETPRVRAEVVVD